MYLVKGKTLNFHILFVFGRKKVDKYTRILPVTSEKMTQNHRKNFQD